MKKKTTREYPCQECKGQCCNHVALPIDKPTCKSDYDNLRWYLLHKNVEIFIDHNKDWYIKFQSECEKQDKKTHLCTIYDDRPKICRDYPNEDNHCEYEGEEEYYIELFTSTGEFESYLDKKKIKWKYKKF